MRKVTVVPEKKLLVAQGGALISDLDQAAAEYGLATGTYTQSPFANWKWVERLTIPELEDSLSVEERVF